MESLIALTLIAILLIITAIRIFYGFGKDYLAIVGTPVARIAVDQWAEKSGYQIVSCERRRFREGPFYLRSGPMLSFNMAYNVFRAVVIGSDGAEHIAWVRTEYNWRGQIGEWVSVVWQEGPDWQARHAEQIRIVEDKNGELG